MFDQIKKIKLSKDQIIVSISFVVLLAEGLAGLSAKRILATITIYYAIIYKISIRMYARVLTFLFVALPLFILIKRDDLARDDANLIAALISVILFLKLRAIHIK